MSDFELWAVGVLRGVSAPVDATNLDTEWAWSGAESGPDRMRWFNPLNTSWYMPGAVPMNSIPVWRYASLQDGIDASVATLLNGYYPVILANLRASVPRQQWANACANLGTWGTGCAWLGRLFGPAPITIGDAEMPALLRHTSNGAVFIVDAAGKRFITAAEAAALSAAFPGLKAVDADAALDQIPDALSAADRDAILKAIAAIPKAAPPTQLSGTITGKLS